MIKVGVIRGGPSSEHDVSLKTGGEVLNHLPSDYRGSDVLLDKTGCWHLDGFQREVSQIFDSVDVVFNALHGEFGEDGKAQQIFESFNMPYTGSKIYSSSLAMKKHMARDLFSRAGIKTPKALFFTKDDMFGIDVVECASQVVNSISPLWVVKPSSAGSSVGIKICGSFGELMEAMENAFEYGDTVLVEEFIKGREATCGILEDFRGENTYALPVVEIIPPDDKFFDYEVKYNGATREICPASFNASVKREIEDIAKRAHEALGCCHYSRADFIVSPRGVFLLEVNTLPGLTPESLFPKEAEAVGLPFDRLLDHIVRLALNRH
ncbi:MAG: D-alanine--D-alanine ligase [Candidatus Marinimicrobia bacterium]|nr:D-alanine--D-alanine ligase [Candidatus Neomarinimicrobiota bacterium]